MNRIFRVALFSFMLFVSVFSSSMSVYAEDVGYESNGQAGFYGKYEYNTTLQQFINYVCLYQKLLKA